MAILIIDDDVETIRVLETRLGSEGYDVVTASSATDGLNRVYEQNPDLILLDIVLSEGGGLEVCNRLKSDEKYKKIPIVILTGAYTEEKDIDVGLKLGADAYLFKPYELKELLGTVKRLLPS